EKITLQKSMAIKFRALFTLVVFFLLTKLSAQNFLVKSVITDKHFYNLIVKNGNLYFGTSAGIFVYNKEIGDLELLNASITSQIDENLMANAEKIISTSTQYNYLLPSYYQNDQNQHVFYDSKLFIIGLGTLFIFSESFYNLQPYFSVRAISKNYVGSYGGIFYKGNKLEFPKSTDGKIKEFANNTFICYGGLTHIKDGVQTNYQSETNYEFTIQNRSYGLARDIEEIDDANYLVFSTTGVYLFNLDLLTVQLIEASKSSTPFLVNKETFGNKLAAIYFYNEQKLVKYGVSENKTEIIHKFDTAINCIITISNFQVILALDKEQRLLSYQLDLNTKKLKENPKVLGEFKEIKAHSLASSANFLFVIGDQGVDVLDLNTNQRYPNVISHEMNRLAQFNSGDTLFLGGVNGLYRIASSDLKSHLSAMEEKKINKSSNDLLTSPKLVLSIAGIFLLLTGFWWIKTQQKKRNLVNLSPVVTKEHLDLFIREHLSTVSIELLSTHFQLTVGELYKLMGSNKPGEYIRKLRLEKVKALRAEQKTLGEISATTGFSVSYLKKI
ncbi:MAG: hypothetical protein RLZ13_2020, partial [Bacteroidota bacterium]